MYIVNLEQKSAEYDGLLFDCFWELRLFLFHAREVTKKRISLVYCLF